jgi:hypothetical protein
MIGIAVAALKFLADGRFFRSKSIAYLWPQGVALLGFLLLLYRE